MVSEQECLHRRMHIANHVIGHHGDHSFLLAVDLCYEQLANIQPGVRVNSLIKTCFPEFEVIYELHFFSKRDEFQSKNLVSAMNAKF